MQKLRINLEAHAPRPYRALVDIDAGLRAGTLDDVLQELVRLRISQINGCTFCVDLHGHELRNAVPFAKLNLLANWHDAPCFDARERAALAFAEALTRIEGHAAVIDAHQQLREHLSETEIAELAMVIATINALNRVAISTGIGVPVRKEKAA